MKVGIAGCGSIGVAFGILFADAGHDVTCWDPFADARTRARADLADRAHRLAKHGLLHVSPDELLERVSFEGDLDVAVGSADVVQECAPERLDVKRGLYAKLAALTDDTVPLASSSSAIPASALAEGSDASHRILVAHPGNPPYLLPVIELVPSPETKPDIVAKSRALYESAGLQVVHVHREIEGFVFNRLQGAVLREAYCLVRDGVVGVDDLDKVVRLGLGRRWSVLGPFETADLNTRGGVASHAEKMGPAYERMGAERGQFDPWTPDLVDLVTRERRSLLPLDGWDDRVAWRDEELMRLAVLHSPSAPVSTPTAAPRPREVEK